MEIRPPQRLLEAGVRVPRRRRRMTLRMRHYRTERLLHQSDVQGIDTDDLLLPVTTQEIALEAGAASVALGDDGLL